MDDAFWAGEFQFLVQLSFEIRLNLSKAYPPLFVFNFKYCFCFPDDFST